MAIKPRESSDLRPSYVAQPDMRFATTFLSNDKREYAVNGESLVDKSSGEIFIKRPSDGKVVSFFQNKKYMDELMFELRVLLNNNPSFIYRKEETENPEAYMISTNYDIICANNDHVVDALTENMIFSGDHDYNRIHFRLGSDSTGFFTRITSRDCDKALIAMITNEYNNMISNYQGDDPDYIAERNKMQQMPNWILSNATIHYTLEIYYDTTRTTSSEIANVNMNEQCCVLLPTDKITYQNGIKYIEITIEKVTFDKLQFMKSHFNELSETVKNAWNKLQYPDGRILFNYLNTISFINSVDDIITNNNDFILAMMSVDECDRIMDKMSKLKDSASFYVSVQKPVHVWNINGVWAENMRDVKEGCIIEPHNTETRFNDLESYLSNNNGIIDAYVDRGENPSPLNYFIADGTRTMTDAEVDEAIDKMKASVIEAAKALVSFNDVEVVDNGLYLDKQSGEE